MKFVLKIESGPAAGVEHAIETGEVVKVGFGESAQFRIADAELSEVHFEIDNRADRCLVRDLDSENGTSLNGLPLVEAQLRDGDAISAGQCEFSVSTSLDSQAGSSSTPTAPPVESSGFTSSIAGGAAPLLPPDESRPMPSAPRDQPAEPGSSSGFTSSIAGSGSGGGAQPPITASDDENQRPPLPANTAPAEPVDSTGFSSSIVANPTPPAAKPDEKNLGQQPTGTDAFSSSIVAPGDSNSPVETGSEAIETPPISTSIAPDNEEQILIHSDFSQSVVAPQPSASGTAVLEPDQPNPALDFFRGLDQPLFAIMDAARDPMVLATLMQSDAKYQSLYEGLKGDQLMAVAPYLVQLPTDSELLEKLTAAWGDSWGIYMTSDAPFDQVRKHFRHFLIVQLEDGKQVYFRFYDPRVFRVYLPTCTPAEKTKIFGPIHSYYCEDGETDEVICFQKTEVSA